MESAFFSFENYQFKLMLYLTVASMALQVMGARLLRLVPEFRQLQDLNREAAEKRRQNWPGYDAVQRHGIIWALPFNILFFFGVFPFFLTEAPQPWWNMLLDIFAVLMFYDLIYYFTHRFVFHDGGPLVWMHAVHHQQKNPCRKDSSYIHPLESVIGLALFTISVALPGLLLGDLHWLSLLVCLLAFGVINTHNHALMETDYFPFRFLKYISDMHHVHHLRFSSGNFATITLFYDWLFGTYDTGEGWGRSRQKTREAGQ